MSEVISNTTNITEKIVIKEGVMGEHGLSAYQVWLAQGNVGTEKNYLDSLAQPALDVANLKAAELNTLEKAIESKELARESNEDVRKSNESDRELAEGIRVSIFNDNESDRQIAENTRTSTFNTNESNRQSEFNVNELARQSNETVRISNESSRSSTESIRSNNESSRIGVENARVVAEGVRNTKESNRASAESVRVTSENTRISNETARKNAETGRVNAELSRVAIETNRVGAEDSRVIEEGKRNTSETNRVDAESLRVISEEGRIDAEANRELAETTRSEFYEEFRSGLDSKADKLKVATIEKDLHNYQSTMANVNVNQEVKQSVSGHGIISLPKNSANGQVSSSVKGLTLKNELNYNRDTWAEWILNDRSSVSNGNLVVGIHTGGVARLPSTFKPNTKYGFILTKVNSTLSGLSMSSASVFPFSTAVSSTTLVGNFKWIATSNAEITDNSFNIFSNNSSEAPMEIKDIRCFELPAGSEIENDFDTMTADQLAQKYPYIEGDSVKSTISASRLKSVGKNLFDGKLELGGYTTTNGLKDATIDKIRSVHKIKVKPNTTYTLQNITENVNVFMDSYREDGSFIKYERTGVKTMIMTTTNDTRYLSFYSLTKNLNCIFQLEQNTIATPYEPYTESTQYLPNVGELRSLPNGVRDEIRVSEKKLIKRVESYVLRDSDIEKIVVGTNVDLIETKVNIVTNATTWDWGYEENNKLNGKTENTLRADLGWDNASNIGKYSAIPNQRLWIYFNKGTFATLQDAKNWFVANPQLLTYQLAEPITAPIEVSGTLLSNPSGTVYVENVVADAGLYSDGLSVLNQDLPIAEIESISKVDFTTGVETSLDVSKVVVNEDKLSFTHSDLENGDIVFFTYFYDKEGTLGETTIEYYDSRHVLKDTVTGKFYKIEKSVTDGELIETLVEV